MVFCFFEIVFICEGFIDGYLVACFIAVGVGMGIVICVGIFGGKVCLFVGVFIFGVIIIMVGGGVGVDFWLSFVFFVVDLFYWSRYRFSLILRFIVVFFVVFFVFLCVVKVMNVYFFVLIM